MMQSEIHMSGPQSPTPLKDHNVSSQSHHGQDLQRTFKSEPVPYRSPSLPLQVIDVEDFDSNTDISQRESSNNDTGRPVGLSQDIRSTVSQGGNFPVNDAEEGAIPLRGSISRGTVGNSAGGSTFSSGSLGGTSGSPTIVSNSSSSVPVITAGVGGRSGEHNSSPATYNRLYNPLGEQRNQAEGRIGSLGLGMWPTQGGSFSRELLNSSPRSSVSGSISSIRHFGSINMSEPVPGLSPAHAGSLDHGTKVSNSAAYTGKSPTTDTSNDVPFYMKSLST